MISSSSSFSSSSSAPVDPRSEKNIATLLPAVQPVAREFIRRLVAAGLDARIISGTRTYAEQAEIFAQGRTKPGRIVTHVGPGYSNHNFGIAFDIGIFKGGVYLDESPLYKEAAPIGKALGLAWGGDWHSFVDEPHYELHPPWAAGMSESGLLAALRQRKSYGQPVFPDSVTEATA